jgi:hypothetical protein
MKYFSLLPKLTYQFENGEYTVIDIFTKIGVKSNFYSNDFLYYEETVDTVKTPEKYSLSKYGSFDYYWLLMLVNQVYNPHTDWPISQDQFGADIKQNETKKTFYVYENGPIVPNDILYLNDSQYGVIESWNPFYKELVIKTNFNLPTTNLSSYTFKIRRINKDGSYTEITNYCGGQSTNFNVFGSMPFLTSPSRIADSSGRFLNPFLKVVGGNVSTDLLIDTCDSTDKTAFNQSLIYNVVNNIAVNNTTITTKEETLTSEYFNKTKLNVVSESVIFAMDEMCKKLLKDKTATANTLFRIG